MSDPTVTITTKPKRARKAKRKSPDPATPRRPRTTILSRIAAMGPDHLAAYRALCDGTLFDAELRHALTADAALRAAEAKRDAADAAVRRADAEYRAALEAVNEGKAVLATLDTLARQIATARGDVPSTDDAHAATVSPASDPD